MNGQRLKEYNDGTLNTLKTIVTFEDPIGKLKKKKKHINASNRVSLFYFIFV